MATNILMPALSPTMTEGNLARWLKNEGDKVRAGDVIAEIETDKATMEVEAVDEGTVAQILVPAGTEKVRVNQPIAVILAEGEGPPPKGAVAPADPRPPTVQPAARQQPTAMPVVAKLMPVAPAEALPPPLPVRPAAASADAEVRQFVSPLARRIAREQGVDLARLAGSGPHGRIVKRDVDGALAAGASKPVAALVPPVVGTAVAMQTVAPPPAIQPMADDKILQLYEAGSYEVLPHDGMRRIIAQRLTQSKQTVPHFYLSLDCRLDELLRARERINSASPKDGPKAYKLSVNDFVIKALALALQRVPGANATWTEAGMLRHRHSDVGVAVAVEGGLFTPVIKHAELKTLGEISNEMKDMAERARKRRLAPHEYQGGTTSISNLGMFGIKSFDAVINPPHATILAVGAGEKRPVVAGDRIEIATVMSCTLSCDHRVVDGALGAELLNAFKTLIEDPVRMLV